MVAGKPRLRLHVTAALDASATVSVDGGQAHYLRDVMRVRPGDMVALFNGRDGEWLARVADVSKRMCGLAVVSRRRSQESDGNLALLFAPVKGARLDFLAQKATELGVSMLMPVITARTQVRRVNVARLQANAIEAAEQCERLTVPAVQEPVLLAEALEAWPGSRVLLVADETGGGPPVTAALENGVRPGGVLVGPEGGLAPDELDVLGKTSFVTRVGLGPRVLRAETAALAALAVVQATCGDWGRPRTAIADTALETSRHVRSE